MIEIKNLSKWYGSVQVLEDINIRLEKGHVYGIAGKNGAGKSTLFRCIAGLETFSGEIESDYDHLKNHLGLLETNPVFMSRITGWEYLKLLCIARGIHQDNFEDQNIFELPLSQYATSYSTGMRKKLALMAIILQKNDVYILDEPFNGVDLQSNMVIVDLIREMKNKGKTILISSHIYATLSETCDQICLIEDGIIKKRVSKYGFSNLESEMKKFIVTDQVKKLPIL